MFNIINTPYLYGGSVLGYQGFLELQIGSSMSFDSFDRYERYANMSRNYSIYSSNVSEMLNDYILPSPAYDDYSEIFNLQ